MQKRSLRIFISHSSNDLPFTEKLAQDLRVALGDPEGVWYDASNLSGGESWWPTILTELNRSTTFLIVCSPDAMRSHWVDDEINIAWRLRNRDRLFRLIPLLYQPCDLRSDLATLQCVSFLKPTPYQEAFQKLLKTLSVGSVGHREQQGVYQLSTIVPVSSLFLTERLSRRMVIGGVTGLMVAGGSFVWWVGTHMPQSIHVLQDIHVPQSTHTPQSTHVLQIGTLLYTYTGHPNIVETVAWSPDGERIASVGDDDTVQVWASYVNQPLKASDALSAAGVLVSAEDAKR